MASEKSSMNHKGGKKNIKVWEEGAGTAQPHADQRTDPEKRDGGKKSSRSLNLTSQRFDWNKMLRKEEGKEAAERVERKK